MRLCVTFCLLLWIMGCAGSAKLIETEEPLVSGCRMLGVVTETANAGIVSNYAARRIMLNNVENRARHLGATHLVWLHRTDQAAAARAYRCE